MEWYWWMAIAIVVVVLLVKFNVLGDFVEALIDAVDIDPF